MFAPLRRRVFFQTIRLRLLFIFEKKYFVTSRFHKRYVAVERWSFESKSTEKVSLYGTKPGAKECIAHHIRPLYYI